MPEREQVEIIAGEARLVRRLDLKHELQGGSVEDRKEAEQWIKQFLPDLVYVCGK